MWNFVDSVAIAENSIFMCVICVNSTHFGSQCAIRKSKLMRVTNMSVSRRISCTLGGGSAIANPTMPNKGGADFLEWPNMNCGLKRHSNSTTCVRVYRNTKLGVWSHWFQHWFFVREIDWFSEKLKKITERIRLPDNPTIVWSDTPFSSGWTSS